ncbi:hypothetical protein TM5383_01361 [Thalassovita mediterranea]|uniref:Uncharacterized protein n=1 Tax=Thalassovita mediterranea TaxID=340021 RepID=A0A0P1GPA4_9RHOB|nr:hypothetical protein TM5383_01361 [Thalassovita mediterranea]SIS27633.1 hypothetical protein SAMN05421685_101151 [Thalassovita mediterranea]
MSYVTVIKSVQLSTLIQRFFLDGEGKVKKYLLSGIWDGKFPKSQKFGHRPILANEGLQSRCEWWLEDEK